MHTEPLQGWVELEVIVSSIIFKWALIIIKHSYFNVSFCTVCKSGLEWACECVLVVQVKGLIFQYWDLAAWFPLMLMGVMGPDPVPCFLLQLCCPIPTGFLENKQISFIGRHLPFPRWGGLGSAATKVWTGSLHRGPVGISLWCDPGLQVHCPF